MFVHSSGEENVPTYDFFRETLLTTLAIIDSITVVVHRVDSLRFWLVLHVAQCCIVITTDTIFRIVEIGQRDFTLILVNVHHNIGFLLCRGRTHLMLVAFSVKRILIPHLHHIAILRIGIGNVTA